MFFVKCITPGFYISKQGCTATPWIYSLNSLPIELKEISELVRFIPWHWIVMHYIYSLTGSPYNNRMHFKSVLNHLEMYIFLKKLQIFSYAHSKKRKYNHFLAHAARWHSRFNSIHCIRVAHTSYCIRFKGRKSFSNITDRKTQGQIWKFWYKNIMTESKHDFDPGKLVSTLCLSMV